MGEGVIVWESLVQASHLQGAPGCNTTRHVAVVAYCACCSRVSRYPSFGLWSTVQPFQTFVRIGAFNKKFAVGWPNSVSSSASQTWVIYPGPIRTRLFVLWRDVASLQPCVAAALTLGSPYEYRQRLFRAGHSRYNLDRRCFDSTRGT